MNEIHFDKKLIAVVLVLGLMSLACNALATTRTNEMRTDTRTIEMNSASSAKVQIDIGAGELNVQGGANSLMDATFRYNVDEWKPRVDYSESGDQGELTVTQQGDKTPVGSQLINTWDIRLSNDIPMDLAIHTGAGQSELFLGGMNLADLEVNTGAGATHIDLSGAWQQDARVSIEGGVGEIVVKLPSDTGVRVNMDTALVNVMTSGLDKNGGQYVNAAYGNSAHTLSLDITAGVGTVSLEVSQP